MVGYRRRARLTKWAIFSVALPLLPIGAHVAAAWLNEDLSAVNFAELFSDGELLVLATVLAAAGIGDLVFDDGPHDVGMADERLAKAGLTAFALIVVVVAVLLFGLVTFENTSRSGAFKAAQAAALARRLDAENRLRVASQQEAQAARLDEQSARLHRALARRRKQAVEEISGRSGTRSPGAGPAYALLQAQIRLLEQQSNELQAEAARARDQASAAQRDVVERLVTTEASVSRGRKQAAWASVMMFLIAVASGYLTVRFTTQGGQRSQSRHGSDSGIPVHDNP